MVGINDFLLKWVLNSVEPQGWSVYNRDRDGDAHSIFINSVLWAHKPKCSSFDGKDLSHVFGSTKSQLWRQINYLEDTTHNSWHEMVHTHKNPQKWKISFQATVSFLNIMCLISGPMWFHWMVFQRKECMPSIFSVCSNGDWKGSGEGFIILIQSQRGDKYKPFFSSWPCNTKPRGTSTKTAYMWHLTQKSNCRKWIQKHITIGHFSK